MGFPARFAGKCKACGNPIEKGQFITWSRRERGSAAHVDCSNPNAIPEAKAEPVSAEVEALKEQMAQMLELIKSGKLEGGLPIPSPLPKLEDIEPKPKLLPTKASDGLPKDDAPWHELLTAILKAFNKEYIRVLLIGPPGTGKSKTSLLLSGNTPYRVTMTEGMGVEDCIGMYQLIKGETVWVHGPWVKAMAEGMPILVDEIDHHPSEIGSGLYGWLDDNPHAMLPTGEMIQAKPGYCVLATTNSNVTSLPAAILDRFDAVIPAIQPHPEALAMFEQEPMRCAVENHFKHLTTTPWQWSGQPTLRRMRAFARLKPILGEQNAAMCAFGNAGAEILGVLTTSARTKDTPTVSASGSL